MDRNEFIVKLQKVYVGDKNAFNEIVKKHEDLVSYACDLEDEICNLNGEIRRLKEENDDLKIRIKASDITGVRLEKLVKATANKNKKLTDLLEELEEGYKTHLKLDLELAKKYGYCLSLTIIEASESILKTIQKLKKKYGLKESDKL